MFKKVFDNTVRVVLLLLLVLALVMIRMMEHHLFYDPLSDFFGEKGARNQLPSIDALKLLASLCMRYGLNTVISLAMIYLVFMKGALVEFAAMLYGIFFLFFMAVLFILVLYYSEDDTLLLFYVRRFLLHPLLLLLFIPGFYCQDRLRYQKSA